MALTEQEVDSIVSGKIRKMEANVSTSMETFVTDRLTAKFTDKETYFDSKINGLIGSLATAAHEAEQALAKAQPVRTKKVAGLSLTGLQHKSTPDLLNLLAAHMHPLLVGPAGSGKSMGAQLCAEAMKLDFYVQSVGAQTSMSQIFGFMDANTNYRPTHFRTAYENGGVFCMDEIDAGNANVLIGINSALANGLCAFPDAIIKVHPNFYFIATANTIGRGATAKYTGRNRLDEATLDRFVALHWDYDAALETILAGPSQEEQDWLNFVWKVRNYVEQNGIQVVISTRAIMKGSAMIPYFSKHQIVEMLILNQLPKDSHQTVLGL